jgi:hypothetical protein
MSQTSDPKSEAISSLSSEADAALRFTSLAAFEQCPATRTGHIKIARSHYEAALRLARRVLLSPDDEEALNGMLEGVKSKLEALGERFGSNEAWKSYRQLTAIKHR